MLDRAVGDDGIRAIVIVGAERMFGGGAEISLLEAMSRQSGPYREVLRGLLTKIEDSPKPVVMAIHGFALGGGLELAMAGHYRIATASARLGQPEVNLGMIPGAQGTQRLPRLVGVRRAIEMCVTGDPLTGGKALKAGLVDAVVEGDLQTAAVAFAAQISETRRTRERHELLGTEEPEAAIAAGRELATKLRPRQIAPLRVIEAIQAATTMPFSEGCLRERAIFEDCLAHEQARALIHICRAEQASQPPYVLEPSRDAQPVNRVAIVGAGAMGRGIALACAKAGVSVLLKECGLQALDRGMAGIRAELDNAIRSGRLTAAQAEEQTARIHPQLDWSGFDGVEVAIEAVFEDIELKKEVFRELDQQTQRSCLLATNTSSLDVDQIARATARPQDVVGLHFFNPATAMKVIEIVRGKATSTRALGAAFAFTRKVRKTGVLVGNGPRFVGNRLFFAYSFEAQLLVEEGATPDLVDLSLTRFGMAMGVFRVLDMAGIDLSWRVLQQSGYLPEQTGRTPVMQHWLYERGRFGKKTRKGWFAYGEDGQALVDPEVLALLELASRKARIVRRSVGEAEIVDRCLHALINQGARVLETNLAQRAGDLDVLLVHGYGFPAWRGGPMHFADQVGLDRVLAQVELLHQEYGSRWKPAPLLQRLVREGLTFRDFDRDTGLNGLS